MIKLQLLQSRKNGLLFLTVFDQISGSRRSMLLFLLPVADPIKLFFLRFPIFSV
jgi:hypothetical protein